MARYRVTGILKKFVVAEFEDDGRHLNNQSFDALGKSTGGDWIDFDIEKIEEIKTPHPTLGEIIK